jgi:hypothetical protein
MSDEIKADEYRRRAEACQRQANRTNDISLKRQYEEFASRWLSLAQQIELNARTGRG